MIFDLIKAAILGVVEGVTEFLPISSTGHLIIVNQWLSFGAKFTELFDVVIQLGAILAVVVFFWKRLWPFGKDAGNNKETRSVWFKAVVGVLPAIVIGALLGNIVQEKLFNPVVVAAALIVGGIILIWLESRKKEAKINSVKVLSYGTAFCIGLVQCLALVPGTSRSAATIIGAMLFGASRVVATEFSFFLAIPTMVAASAYSLFKYKGALSGSEKLILVVGFVVSFLVALAVIKFLMSYIQKHSFRNFGIYRIVLGLLVLALFFAGYIGYNKNVETPTGHSDVGLPLNYTLKQYTVEKVLDASCKVDNDCVTPGEYMMISRCPMKAICIDAKCTVVCPSYKEIQR